MWIEIINYLEHYGLTREQTGLDEDGNPIYESIGPMHSWNAPASIMAFKLQRHSDHHCHGFRPYQILRHYEKAPTYPYEYAGMIMIMAFPPVFFYFMNPKLDAITRVKKGIQL